MTVIQVVRDLVAIPSFVDNDNNEVKLADFIFEYLQQFKYLTVEKQFVDDQRYNIIAHDNHPPRLMFCSHMDTVHYSGEWEHSPFSGRVDGDRLYGLGSADMKGGMGCVLDVLRDFDQTKGLYLLFDVDEEYYFKGMLKFLEENNVAPEIAVFPEPGTKILNGHRGLIEIDVVVRGITGHASRPKTGKNAIRGLVQAIDALESSLEKYKNPYLGSTSCNLAHIEGGLDGGIDESGKRRIIRQANSIPNIAKATIDIRPSDDNVRAKFVIALLSDFLSQNDYSLEKAETKLDLGSFFVDQKYLKNFEEIVTNIFGSAVYVAEPGLWGYGEAQLLNENLGVNCVYFGPEPQNGHKMNEYVSITSLKNVREVYRQLVKLYCDDTLK